MLTAPNSQTRHKLATNRWAGVLALLVVVTISYVDRVNVSVLITDDGFLSHFGIDGNRTAQGALMTAFLLGYGVAAFFLTPYYESALGVRRGLLVSIAIWSVATLISPYAGTSLILIAFRAILGMSEGPLFSLKTMYIAQEFDATERGKPNAVSSMGVSLGTAIGIPLITFLVFHLNWHLSFIALAVGNAVIGLTLVAAFIHVGKIVAARTPLTTVISEALRTPHIVPIMVIECATLAYLWGSASWLPSYLRDDRHFSIAAMGIVASLPFIVSLLSGLVSGWLIDRLPQRLLAVIFVVGAIGTAGGVIISIASHSDALVATGLLVANAFWGYSALGYKTPAEYAAGCTHRHHPVGCEIDLTNRKKELALAPT